MRALRGKVWNRLVLALCPPSGRRSGEVDRAFFTRETEGEIDAGGLNASPRLERAPSDCSAATSPACFADEGGRTLQTPMTSPACASLLSQAMKVLASFEGVRQLG